ncbi:MAG: ABC transporter ATP-binding protein [Nitrospirae bacterium]|nr:ABC transporter ATP-binding protein [Nitrospirota bacterium]
MNRIITLRGLKKDYKKTPALKGIDLDIVEAEITGIIGPDGAGKSTLLKVCTGILSYKGSVRYRGQEVSEDPERVKKDLSFMPQGIGQNLYMDLTVEENISFFASLKAVPEDVCREKKGRLLEMTGLAGFRNRLAGHLSGGMKQKLGICCALISEPGLLVLDEPSTGIDPLSRRQLWDILNEYLLQRGTTIIIGTSYMDEAERCHSIMFLHNGESIYNGKPEALIKTHAGLEDAFFEMLTERGHKSQKAELPPDAERYKDTEGIMVRDLVKSFGSFRAVDGVSFEVSPGEIFGLLGPNGAGKTTLIKCMIGLLKPDTGTVRLSGLEPGSKGLKYRLGYMSQVFSLYNDLTVAENIELYGTLYRLDRNLLKRRRDWILDFSNLKGYETLQVRRLPLGVKQRLSLGCAVLHLPQILFLDEPTSGVDPVARGTFWEFIRMLSRELGITVVVTTHNLIEADYCDRVAIMDEGRIIAMDTPQALKDEFSKTQGKVFEVYPPGKLPEEEFRKRGIALVPFGRRYHIWKRGLYKEEIESFFKDLGVRYHYLREIPPPMEDVFIHNLKR